MASTRSRNTPGDYESEQRAYTQNLSYMSYETSSHYGVAANTHLPGDGLIGMRAPHRVLSNNYCDIESQLFGIGSSNLVSAAAPVQPEIHQLKSLDIFDKQRLVMPSPFLPQANQRPLYLN
jgi:hypothetical protein